MRHAALKRVRRDPEQLLDDVMADEVIEAMFSADATTKSPQTTADVKAYLQEQ